MDDEEMVKKLAKLAQAFSDPIDFDKLIEDGLLVKKGRSYYALDIHALPKNIGMRIKEAVPTKNGLRVTFYKESKSLKKLANKLSGYLD
jgi:hypothetical protein